MTGVSSAIAFLVLVVVLLVKPSGIAGREVREA
jgi:branched-subunit amino acid ABC-type transport system permease component